MRNLERAALLLELALGPAHPETLPVRGQYAFVLKNHAWGNPAAAEAGVPVARRLLADVRAALGPTAQSAVLVQTFLFAVPRIRRLEEGEAVATQAEVLALQNFGPDHEIRLMATTWESLSRPR